MNILFKNSFAFTGAKVKLFKQALKIDYTANFSPDRNIFSG